MKRFSPAGAALLLVFLTACAAPSGRPELTLNIPAAAPRVADLPAELPEARTVLPTGTVFFAADPAEADLGVGHLAPQQVKGTGWAGDIILPLFAEADGAQRGWLANGWILQEGKRAPLTSRGMVPTGRKSFAFLVHEARTDGWLRVRYHDIDETRDGTAWVHADHLALGGHQLQFTPWEDQFQAEGISPLYFRNRSVNHALRRRAGRGSALIAWIGADHDIALLEHNGDWAKVRVTQPSTWCRSEKRRGRSATGWLKWRDAEKGPWLWYRTAGCK